MNTVWVEPDFNLAVGDVGFLVKYTQVDSPTIYEMINTPAFVNGGDEPRLTGWCGTLDGVSTRACGMCKVLHAATNGWVLVRPLADDELAAALAKCGYPELMPVISIPILGEQK